MTRGSTGASKLLRGAVMLALGAVALVAPVFFARSLPLLVGCALLSGGLVQLRGAFSATSGEGRAARFGSAVVAVVAGLLVIALPGLAIDGAALLLGVLIGIDGIGRLIQAWRELGRPGWLGAILSGAVIALLGVLLAVQWPLAGATAIAVVAGLHLVSAGWATLAGTDVEPGAATDSSPGALIRRLDLPESDLARRMVGAVAPAEAASEPIERWWVAMFLATFFAIHIGRMDTQWTVVGLLSPLGAAAGDAIVAVLLGVLLILPARVSLRRLSMPLERRAWSSAVAREARSTSPGRLGRLQERWLEHRTRQAIRTDAAVSSPSGALRAGLRLGVPLVAVLVATNPIWGFSWYFNSENWVTAIWERFTEERVDDWRTAMVRAAAASSPGVPEAELHRVAPEGTASGDFSFLVIGDPGEGDPSQLVLKDRIVELGQREDVRFLVVSSDVIYPAGSMRDFEPKFYLPFKGFAKPIVAIPGNHDWYDALDAFAANFLRPEAARLALRARVEADLRLSTTTDARIDEMVADAARLRAWYSIDAALQRATYFEIQSDRFALLAIDTGILRTIDDDQLAWLKAALERARGKFIMAVIGHPFYAGGALQATDGRFAEIRELLLQHDVGIVMGGDTHDFEFYLEPGRDGAPPTRHFVNGGGGAYLSIGTALSEPATSPVPDWGFYPGKQAVIEKLDAQTPSWKWPIWLWVRDHEAWPSLPETLSAAFDFNRAPFFQSFVEVRVEPSKDRVRVLLHGAEGQVRWRDLQQIGSVKPDEASDDDVVEFVAPMAPVARGG